MNFKYVKYNTFHLVIFVILKIYLFTEQFKFSAATNFNLNIHTDCTKNGLLLIKGDVISIAELIETVDCWSEASRINIFALNKVIFDNDIDKRDVLHVNITIFAPTWEIIPPSSSSFATENQTKRRILLNTHFDFNFFGTSIEKINGERLQFSVDGDKNRIRMMNDSDHRSNESSLLKQIKVLTSDFNEMEILKAYKHYARKNLEKSKNHSKLWEFLVELSTQYGLVNVNELIDDFMCLEDKYFDLKKDIDVIPLYQSIRNQLENLKQQLDGHENLQQIFHVALVGKILAIRKHTAITEIEQLNGFFYLNHELGYLGYNYKLNHEDILKSHSSAFWMMRTWSKEFIEMNMVFIDRIYNQTDRNDDDAIVRRQMEFPLKSIQLVLLTVARYISIFPGFPYIIIEKQLFLSKCFEKFQYKLILFEEVLRDFAYILKHNGDDQYMSSDFNNIQRTVGDSLVEVSELLAQSNENRTNNLITVLFNSWPNLSDVIDDTKLHLQSQKNQNESFNVVQAIDQLVRMQGLIKCSQMGIKVYRDCYNDPAKLMAFVQKFDRSFKKHQSLLELWKEYEKIMYKNTIDLFDRKAQILPHLNALNKIFRKMQQYTSAYDSDIKRAIQDTYQANKLAINNCNANQLFLERDDLVNILSDWRDEVDPESRSIMNTLKEIIKSNVLLEICLTMTHQTRKMHVFPFEQDHYDLCNLPVNVNVTSNSTNVRRILRDNINKIESGIDYANRLRGDVVSFSDENVVLYEWKHKDFDNEIYNLLHGKEITLNADIANANTQLNAVKFSKIRLEFNFANKTRQNEFYDAASIYYVKLTMLGNHYYRCDNRIYYVPSVLIDFPFEYQIDFSSISMFTIKYGKKDPIFSPYTIWKIKMRKDFPDQQQKSFSPEDFLGDEIDLRLVGNIDYVANEGYGKQICTSDKLSKNYFFDRIVEGNVILA